MDRKNCNSIIHVNELELQNFISNDLYVIIINKTTNSHKLTCDFFKNSLENNNNLINNNLNLNTNNSLNSLTHLRFSDDINKKIFDLINLNLFKSFSFHENNLINNNINISNSQLKHLLYTYRNKNFPKNETYLTNLFNYKIKLSEDKNMKEKCFCLAKGEYFNPQTNNVEKYLIYSTDFQLNLFTSSKHIYIDGTFKSVPSNYYQLVTLHCFNKLTQKVLPVIFILMNFKTGTLYNNVFSKIREIILLNNYKYKFKNLQSDFEIAIINELTKVLNPEINLMGCFFHYIKALWSKLKELKIKIFKYKIYYDYLIKTFKYLIFIEDTRRISFFNLFSILFIETFINTYTETNDKKYFIKFINYYRKVWLNYKQIWGDLNTDINFTRTNNPCEIYHRRVNELISLKNPKIFYFVDSLFLLSKKYYKDYISHLGTPNKKIKNCFLNHTNNLELFNNAINSFLEHKQLSILFEEIYYKDFYKDDFFDELDNFYYDEEEENI